MAYTWQDYKGLDDTARAIGRKVEAVKADPASFGVLSTGERLAVALVLNRFDLLAEQKYTMLEAVERLGDEWLRSAILVAKAMDA